VTICNVLPKNRKEDKMHVRPPACRLSHRRIRANLERPRVGEDVAEFIRDLTAAPFHRPS